MRARPAGERGGKRSDRNFRTRVPRAHTMVVKQINSAGVVGGCTTQNAWEYVIGTDQWRYLYTRLCVFIYTLLGAHISIAALPATYRVHTRRCCCWDSRCCCRRYHCSGRESEQKS